LPQIWGILLKVSNLIRGRKELQDGGLDRETEDRRRKTEIYREHKTRVKREFPSSVSGLPSDQTHYLPHNR